MPNTPAGMRECPTRADGERGLFAHVIAPSTCQERQRRYFHKCPTCSYCNARNGVPAPAVLLPRPQLPERVAVRTLGRNGPALQGPAAVPQPARPA